MADPRFALLLSLLPLIAFFVLERWVDLRAAIAAAMVLVLIELAVQRWFEGKVRKLTLLTAGLVLGLGSMSLLSDDPRFVLWSPVVGDLIFAAILLGTVAIGRSALEAALEEQAPDEPLHPLQRRFARGLTVRLGLNLVAHAAITAWATEQPREVWLLVSGPLQYAMLGVQVIGEAAWARLVVLPAVEADDPRD